MVHCSIIGCFLIHSVSGAAKDGPAFTVPTSSSPSKDGDKSYFRTLALLGLRRAAACRPFRTPTTHTGRRGTSSYRIPNGKSVGFPNLIEFLPSMNGNRSWLVILAHSVLLSAALPTCFLGFATSLPEGPLVLLPCPLLLLLLGALCGRRLLCTAEPPRISSSVAPSPLVSAAQTLDMEAEFGLRVG